MMKICDAFHDLVPFIQFKKREKHPWRNVIFSRVKGITWNFTKSNNTSWVLLTFFKLYT